VDKRLKNSACGQDADRYDGHRFVTRISKQVDLDWLRRLDSYTNTEFGQCRSWAISRSICVTCGGFAPDADTIGLCAKCAAKRRADTTEIILFRPLRRVVQE